jgi:hypothetical protein
MRTGISRDLPWTSFRKTEREFVSAVLEIRQPQKVFLIECRPDEFGALVSTPARATVFSNKYRRQLMVADVILIGSDFTISESS